MKTAIKILFCTLSMALTTQSHALSLPKINNADAQLAVNIAAVAVSSGMIIHRFTTSCVNTALSRGMFVSPHHKHQDTLTKLKKSYNDFAPSWKVTAVLWTPLLCTSIRCIRDSMTVS